MCDAEPPEPGVSTDRVLGRPSTAAAVAFLGPYAGQSGTAIMGVLKGAVAAMLRM